MTTMDSEPEASVPSTLLQAQLASMFAASDAALRADLDKFWQAWQQTQSAGDSPLPAPRVFADFQPACAAPGGARQLLAHLRAVATQSGRRPLLQALSPAARDLIKVMAVAALESHIQHRQLPGARLDGPGQPLTVHAANDLTADLLAATQLNAGPQLARSPGDTELRMVNAVRAAPVLTFNDSDVAFDAWCTELLAWAQLKWGGDQLSDASIQRRRLVNGGIADPDDTKDELLRVLGRDRLKPVVSIEAGDDKLALTHSALFQQLQMLGATGYQQNKAASDSAVAREVGFIDNAIRAHVQALFDALDGVGHAMPAGQAGTVFISYAHKFGGLHCERLRTFLRGVGMVDARIEAWSDQELETGDAWERKIEEAMGRATCAVLMLDGDFLASSFINRRELPILLDRRRSEGMHLFPIQVGTCNWINRPELSWLQTQCAQIALNRMDGPNQDVEFTKLAALIFNKFQPAPTS